MSMSDGLEGVLDIQLGLAVRVDWGLRHIFDQRQAVGLAEGGASRGEDELFDAHFEHRLDQVESGDEVVVVVLDGVVDALANISDGQADRRRHPAENVSPGRIERPASDSHGDVGEGECGDAQGAGVVSHQARAVKAHAITDDRSGHLPRGGGEGGGRHVDPFSAGDRPSNARAASFRRRP